MNLYAIMLLLMGLLTVCIGVRPVADSRPDSLGIVYAISGTVQQQFPYCGGARPTPAMLTKAATPVAYPNKTFYVRAGNTNRENGAIIKRFTTDKDGLYSLTLSPGTYSIIVEEQVNPIDANDYKSESQTVNEICLAEWWKKPYHLLEVNHQSITSLNFTVVHRCFLPNDIPCITYIGPMPH